MYSAVLMLALTAGSEAVDFGKGRGCVGSCSGVVVGSCVGSCGGVVVGGCNGCQGGHGCRGGIFGGHRHGGCNGSCTGSCGGVVVGGCTGGCTGVVVGGCNGCQGGHGCGLFGRMRHRNHGCNGCDGGCIGSTGCIGGCGGVVVTPATPATPATPKTMPKSEPVPAKPKASTQAFVPATIVVSLPNGARLTVDGTQTTSTSEVRTLVTPALEVGATYVYTLRAEVVNNGQTVGQTQTVTVRGGETSSVRFNFSTQGVASR